MPTNAQSPLKFGEQYKNLKPTFEGVELPLCGVTVPLPAVLPFSSLGVSVPTIPASVTVGFAVEETAGVIGLGLISCLLGVEGIDPWI